MVNTRCCFVLVDWFTEYQRRRKREICVVFFAGCEKRKIWRREIGKKDMGKERHKEKERERRNSSLSFNKIPPSIPKKREGEKEKDRKDIQMLKQRAHFIYQDTPC